MEMKRIETDREEESEPVWTLCTAKHGSAQLVLEKFTLCFNTDRPVNLMAKLESSRLQHKLIWQEMLWFKFSLLLVLSKTSIEQYSHLFRFLKWFSSCTEAPDSRI